MGEGTKNYVHNKHFELAKKMIAMREDVSCPVEISFQDGCFILGYVTADYLHTWNDEIEVIGNIYENPELVKECS